MEDGVPSGGLRRQEALRREREEEHVELVLRGDLRPLGVLLAQGEHGIHHDLRVERKHALKPAKVLEVVRLEDAGHVGVLGAENGDIRTERLVYEFHTVAGWIYELFGES